MNDRVHPFDLLGFGDDEEWLQSVVNEAEANSIDLNDRDRFAGMLCMGEVLKKLVPPRMPMYL